MQLAISIVTGKKQQIHFVLRDPRHGSPGSHQKNNVQVLLEDTGLENISELISLMKDHTLWKSTAVYRHNDDGQP